MAIKVTVANTKGGVGKTTNTVNLAAMGAKLGKRVLMADFDLQGTATSAAGIRELEGVNIEDHSSWRMILDKAKPSSLAIPSKYGFDVIPGSGRLYEAEQHIINTPHGDGILSKMFALDPEVEDKYDLIICDTQGAASRLQRSVLSMTSKYIIPDMPTEDSREQLPLLLKVVEQLNDDLPLFHTQVELLGHFYCAYMRNEKMSAIMDQMSESMFGEKHLKDHFIPHTTVFRQASFSAVPFVCYEEGIRDSKPAKAALQAYENLFKALFSELF